MDNTIQEIILETLHASDEGRIHFGQVISQLMEVHVESYSIDYRNRRASYVLNNDETLTLEIKPDDVVVSQAFDVGAIRAAILSAQQGVVMYPEFKQLSKAAGCIGYTVWIAGRHVAYYGRRGEMHIEPFPN